MVFCFFFLGFEYWFFIKEEFEVFVLVVMLFCWFLVWFVWLLWGVLGVVGFWGWLVGFLVCRGCCFVLGIFEVLLIWECYFVWCLLFFMVFK